MYLIAAVVVMGGWLVWAMQPPKLAADKVIKVDPAISTATSAGLVSVGQGTPRSTSTPNFEFFTSSGSAVAPEVQVVTATRQPTNTPTLTPQPTSTIFLSVTQYAERMTLQAIETQRAVLPTPTEPQAGFWIDPDAYMWVKQPTVVIYRDRVVTATPESP